MIKKLMQLRNTIVALLGIEFVLALLTYMFLQNRVTLALMIYILIKNVVCIIVLYYLHNIEISLSLHPNNQAILVPPLKYTKQYTHTFLSHLHEVSF